MLLHSALYWPQAADTSLWSLAMTYAVWIWNRIPNIDSGYSPEELFYRSKSTHVELNRVRVWGSPLYILDPRLQNGKKIQKWEKRSTTGAFMGFSSNHSSTVNLALNKTTASITPQFHVVHDEIFTTIHNFSSEISNDLWENLTIISRHNDWVPNTDDFGQEIPSPSVPIEWIDSEEMTLRRDKERLRFRRLYETESLSPPFNDLISSPLSLHHEELAHTTLLDNVTTLSPSPSPPTINNPASTDSPSSAPLPSSPLPDTSTASTSTSHSSPSQLRRSKRTRVPNRNVYGGKGGNVVSSDSFLHCFEWDDLHQELSSSSDHLSFMTVINQELDPYSDVYNNMHPLLLASKANSADTPTYNQAMNGSDHDGYVDAMDTEVKTLDNQMKA